MWYKTYFLCLVQIRKKNVIFFLFFSLTFVPHHRCGLKGKRRGREGLGLEEKSLYV